MKLPIPTDSWLVLQASHPNVLVIQKDPHLRTRTLEAVLERTREPVWRCQGDALALPHEPVGTLLVPDVSRLSLEEQHQLLAWAETHRASQIITGSPTPLYPSVASGTFLDALYYRLNVLLLGDPDG
jgi:hypothetical protein